MKLNFKQKNYLDVKIIRINYKTDLKLILETNIWDWTNIITIVNNKVIMLVKRQLINSYISLKGQQLQ